MDDEILDDFSKSFGNVKQKCQKSIAYRFAHRVKLNKILSNITFRKFFCNFLRTGLKSTLNRLVMSKLTMACRDYA